MNSFMRDRYGTDDLNFFMMLLGFLLWGINLFLNNFIILLASVFLNIFFCFRIFSKNIPARRKELNFFNKYYHRYKQAISIIHKNLFKKDKNYYAICRNCRQTLRLPKGKGKIEVSCPKCGYKFDKRT